MELKEFVAQTLIQIVEGVKDAQEKIKESGALINPKTFTGPGIVVDDSSSVNTVRNIQNVKMNVAVTVTENAGNKSGIGIVASVFKAGTLKEESDTNTTTSRIEFDVPVSFPVSKLE